MPDYVYYYGYLIGYSYLDTIMVTLPGNIINNLANTKVIRRFAP